MIIEIIRSEAADLVGLQELGSTPWGQLRVAGLGGEGKARRGSLVGPNDRGATAK